MFGGTAAMAEEPATFVPSATQSIEVVPGEAVTITVELVEDQSATNDNLDAAVTEVTTDVTTAALRCGENASYGGDNYFTLTWYNCSSVSIKLKPDYFFVDGTCKVVTPYGSTSWIIHVNVGNSYIGMISC
ncbi:hypothetical protein [Cryobacterium sp. M91]|uniref:hypothetical protein n=1 Tax=Cryobacterium sp. M91 TaxID=2048294 RepID=UPI000CE5406D|nr:hypothetical protein [Cryobacterium sp. M91]